MKKHLLILVAPLLAGISASAQSNSPKAVNRFDTTLAKKHEISVNIGMARVLGYGPTQPSISLGVEYARVYRANHFLRAGARFSSGVGTTTKRAMTGRYSGPDPANPGGLIEYSTYDNHNLYRSDLFLGAFAGYEYGIGMGSFRFTLGGDLHVGYNKHEHSDAYAQTTESIRFLPTGPGDISTEVTYTNRGVVSGTSANLFVALSPRIGIRGDLGKRFAIAVAFTPQFGVSQQLGYSEITNGYTSESTRMPKTFFMRSLNAEVRLIAKLGKS